MRVLEVGPWDFPAQGYLTDPGLEEYVGVDIGVWEGSKEGNRAGEVFESALLRNGLTVPNAKFFRMPVSAYKGDEFDIVYGANVFGDPLAIPKNTDGTFKHPGEEERILAESLKRLVAPKGRVELLETYTPIKRDVLFETMGRTGLTLDYLVEGSDLIEFLSNMYSGDWERMRRKLDPMSRLKSALRHRIEHGVDSPYMAVFTE